MTSKRVQFVKINVIRIIRQIDEIKRATERRNHKCSLVLTEKEVRWKRGSIIVSIITSVPRGGADVRSRFFRVEHIVYYSSHFLFLLFFFSLLFSLLLFSFCASTRFTGWLASDGLVLLCSGLVSVRVKEDSVICCVWRRRDRKRRLDSVHDSNEEVGELVHRASVIFLFQRSLLSFSSRFSCETCTTFQHTYGVFLALIKI